MYSIDFETEAIVEGAACPPRPVGLAIETQDGKTRYYAFGHPEENNCTEEEARAALLAIWDQPFVGQNILNFDIPVAQVWWGLPDRDPLLTHDTLFQAFLLNPHAKSLSLKPLCAEWLDMPSTDQETLHQWILKNVPECKGPSQAGAYISKAPGGMVGNYAQSDVHMARALHEHCIPRIASGMQQAYDRERRLAPILVDIKHRGIRIDVDRLKADYRLAMQKLHVLDDMVRTELNAPNLNTGSDAELVSSLKGAGYSGFLTTPTGKDSANKASLEKVLADNPRLQSMLRSRTLYATLTSTYFGPWVELCELNGGTINPAYNQVRNEEGFGTRTGRLSSSGPNGQNIPTDQGTDFFGDHFPDMRSYCLPDEGHIWLCADAKSQEPRIAAHFEDDLLMAAFQEDPELDPYEFVKELVGGDITRRDTKAVFLGILYAMGAATLAGRLNCSVERATTIRAAIRIALPGIVELDTDCKRRFSRGLPIKTLGGRLCYCEPPKNGRTWEYKALNLLVQGSAADQTKEAIIYIAGKVATIGGRLLGTVHDEISVSIPPGSEGEVLVWMDEAFNQLPCDVPMRAQAKWGESWAKAAK